MRIGQYFKTLLWNPHITMMSTAAGLLIGLLLPSQAHVASAISVLFLIVVDLLTKFGAIVHQNGGFLHEGVTRAFKSHSFNSKSFMKGTVDKLTIFGVMLIICGAAYRICPYTPLAVGLSTVVFSWMFFRDAISILENLSDAGVSGLAFFKKLMRGKLTKIEEDVFNQDPFEDDELS